MRTEQEIFDDLATLCVSQGYIHALASICYRDNIVTFGDQLEAEDMAKLFSHSRLIRTEVTTLIGLMMRGQIDFALPEQQVISRYIQRSEELLNELHEVLIASSHGAFAPEKIADPAHNPFTNANVLREPIFYGGESAYTFQFRDLAPLKYGSDTEWLLKNKGFDVQIAREVCRSLADLQNENLLIWVKGLTDKPVEEWSLLPGFGFSCAEIADRSGLELLSVRLVVEAFCVPDKNVNNGFTTLHAFNAAYAYPFIRKAEDEFISLQFYGIAEAIYETPFYWMGRDKAYTSTAFKHRGEFAETFAFDRLERVFGADHVFKNVEIIKSKDATLGEIDVMAVFGDRIILVQAKSKKLSLEARSGNDLTLQSDFKSAVQDAVDQAFLCAELLADSSLSLRCKNGHIVNLVHPPKVIYPISLVTDAYPVLAFQARQFLKFKETSHILAPLVIDVFALDAITEMLTSPLRLLSYLTLRARFGDQVFMSHEHVILSYHLNRNLWLANDINLLQLHDDNATDLDIAMAARRDDVPGVTTPPGILTKFEGTPFATLIAEIDTKQNPTLINLGLMLLELGSDTVEMLNRLVEEIRSATAKDGDLHDATLGFAASAGLTIHCSNLPYALAVEKLRAHCERRKYIAKAPNWFGLTINSDGSIGLVIEVDRPWKFNMRAALEVALAEKPQIAKADRISQKVGRNDPCPCGSGKKFKQCCYWKSTTA
jgi:hypothetical protein